MRILFITSSFIGLILIMTAFIYLDKELAPFANPVKFMLVLTATFMAGLLIYSPSLLANSIKKGIALFIYHSPSFKKTGKEIIQLAALSRSDTLMALENMPIEDGFLKRGILLGIQGGTEKNILGIMNTELDIQVYALKQAARVLKTLMLLSLIFGIIGSIIAIIYENTDITNLSLSIITLPTLYGFILSACFFAPLSYKLKEEAHQRKRHGQSILLGLKCILDGDHPSVVQKKLMPILGNLP